MDTINFVTHIALYEHTLGPLRYVWAGCWPEKAIRYCNLKSEH